MSLPARWPSISRTCKSTATNKRPIPLPSTIQRRRPNGHLRLGRAAWAILLALCVVACTPVRPIAKIGLIAPFEGLYRDSGYAALDGMRAAIAACAPPGLDVLPLALDDGGTPEQAQRSAQKLITDPTVIAVIGPLLYPLLPTVGDVMRPADRLWIAPPTVLPSGDFAAPSDPAWLAAQVDFVQSAIQPARLLVVGLSPTLAAEWRPTPGVLRLDDPRAAWAEVVEGDSVLWLGAPDAAAVWLDQAQAAHPSISFWLGAQAGGDILPRHTAVPTPLHWVNWREDGYTDGSEAHSSELPPAPMNQITYQATCNALAGLAGAASPALRP